ncbi:hypothetical protein NQ315_003454 [Exocentrus adspersus]|uniref:Uncharacterized protein n=1 Tax=Exocentrus adspersus TaxID=1586481 RepID=A0AAV8V7C1_9CUCU|nr:hypothetical protein NQ315_003454 [Exocentrus adspersus]
MTLIHSTGTQEEVPILNESHFVDVPLAAMITGSSPVVISENDVNNSLQEIVVGKDQVFQLKKVTPVNVKHTLPAGTRNDTQTLSSTNSPCNIRNTVPVTTNSTPTTQPVTSTPAAMSPSAMISTSPLLPNVVVSLPGLQNLAAIAPDLQKLVGPTPMVQFVPIPPGQSSTSVPIIQNANQPTTSQTTPSAPSGSRTKLILPAGSNSIAQFIETIAPLNASKTQKEGGHDGMNAAKTTTSTNPASSVFAVCICRTCLKLVPPTSCYKLYDSGPGQNVAYELRRKLFDVVEDVDLQASPSPVICWDCFNAIDTAYKFRNQVRSVEELVAEKKKDMEGVLDLKDLLVEAAKRKCGGLVYEDISTVSNKSGSQFVRIMDKPFAWCETVGGDLDQYLEKRKQVLDTSLKGTPYLGKAPSKYAPGVQTKTTKRTSKEKPAKAPAGSSKKEPLTSNVVSADAPENLAKLDSSKESSKIIQNLLEGGTEKEKFVFEIFSDDDDRDDAPPDFGWSDSEMKPDEVLLKSLLEAGTVKNIHTTNRNDDSWSKADQPAQKRRNSGSTDESRDTPVWKKFKSDQNSISDPDSDLDALLGTRKDKAKKFTFENQFTDFQSKVVKPYRSLSDEEVQKKGRFLNSMIRKKPDIPKSFDLFDKEHDEYFENVSEVEPEMVRKWAEFVEKDVAPEKAPYMCEDCGRFISTKKKLTEHLDQHNVTAMCSYCGVQMPGVRLEMHIKVKHEPPTLECELCSKKFHLKSTLKKHVERAHVNPVARSQCQECGAMVKKNNLDKHMKRHKSKQYKCEVCPKVFKDEEAWYEHSEGHAEHWKGTEGDSKGPAEDWKGAVEDRKIPAEDWKDLGEDCKAPAEAKKYICRICSKHLINQKDLDHHLKLHERPTVKCCNICDRGFGTKEELIRHINVVHGLVVTKTTEAEQKPEPEYGDVQNEASAAEYEEETDASIRIIIEADDGSVYEGVLDEGMTGMEGAQLSIIAQTDEEGYESTSEYNQVEFTDENTEEWQERHEETSASCEDVKNDGNEATMYQEMYEGRTEGGSMDDDGNDDLKEIADKVVYEGEEEAVCDEETAEAHEDKSGFEDAAETAGFRNMEEPEDIMGEASGFDNGDVSYEDFS